MLSSIGVSTCGELYDKRGLVAALFTAAAVEFFLEASLGLGARRLGGLAVGFPGVQVARRPQNPCNTALTAITRRWKSANDRR